MVPSRRDYPRWDDETLIAWTSNIQGWTVHGAFEFSSRVQTIYPSEGVATSMQPGDVTEYEVLDIYGRPWAQYWETYHEQGIFSFE